MILFLLQRVMRRPGLAFLAILSIMLPVAVLNSIPIFAAAVDKSVLREEITAFSRASERPPFGIRLYAYGTPRVPLSISLAQPTLNTVIHSLESSLGLSVTRAEVQVHSINFDASTPEVLDGSTEQAKPEHINFVTYPDLPLYAETVTGARYGDPAVSPGDVVNVWLREDLAVRLKVEVGDVFPCEARQQINRTGEDDERIVNLAPVVVRVAGTWRVLPETGASRVPPVWFDNPETSLATSLLVTDADYEVHIEPRQQVRTHRINWDLVLDAQSAEPEEVGRYLAGLSQTLDITKRTIPGVFLDRAPIHPLQAYTSREHVLTAQLLSYSIPGLGFLIFFMALSATLVARGHQRDTVAMLSRGLTTSKLLLMTTIEEALLFTVGFPLGMGLALALARGMSTTRGLLTFEPGAPYPVSLRDASVPMSILALGISLGFRLYATWRQAHTPLIETEQARARPTHAPSWMRYSVDLLIIVPTLYLWRQLARTGSLAALAPVRGEQLLATPELVLVPALFLVTVSLLSVRLFSIVVRALSWAAGFVAPPSMLLAVRHLGRQWQAYATPLVLVILSLSLGVYTFSMALSLDRWLVDRSYYLVGSDLAFSPFLPVPPSSSYGMASADTPLGGSWIPPVQEFRDLQGVLDATRVGRYPLTVATIGAGAQRTSGELLAVDRTEFARVAWYREGLSPQDLGSLMNLLAGTRDAVLVPQWFLDANVLQPGDRLPVRLVVAQGIVIETPTTIAGSYDLFPTVDPAEGLVIIGNLDYVANMGGVIPEHDILAKVDGSTDGLAIFRSVSRMGIEAGKRMDATALIDNARSRHEHVGIFGTLSLGFIAALLLAALALLVYQQTSLQERLWWMTVLHALGLRRSQLAAALVLEQAGLLLYGAGTAFVLGIAASRAFVPLMRIAEGAQSLQPPLLPVVALEQARILVGIFLFAILLADAFLVLRAFARTKFAALRVFQ